MNNNECKLIGGPETYMIQLMLGLLSMSSLYFKRKREYPQRQWNVFKYDVSKQVIGMGVAHMINIAIAILFNRQFKMNDECRWYFLNFFVDTTFGLALNYILLKCSTAHFRKKRYRELIPGEYLPGNYFYNKSFILQLCVWLFIILLSKVVILGIILLPFREQLNSLGKLVLEPVSTNNTLELCTVMIIFPLLFNILQFWIQDNILKGDRHYIDTSLINPSDIEVLNTDTSNILSPSDYSEL